MCVYLSRPMAYGLALLCGLVCGKMKCGDCKVVAEGVRTYVEQTGRRRLAMSLKGVSVENMPF